MEIFFDIGEIEKAAKEFLKISQGYKVLAFSGELGSGKTTFITALCKQLRVTETVSSPTYSIIQEYLSDRNKIVYHIDLYRIRNREEAMEAGIEDCLNSNEICMVEWPEKALQIFPENTIFSSFEIISANRRKLIIQFPR